MHTLLRHVPSLQVAANRQRGELAVPTSTFVDAWQNATCFINCISLNLTLLTIRRQRHICWIVQRVVGPHMWDCHRAASDFTTYVGLSIERRAATPHMLDCPLCGECTHRHMLKTLPSKGSPLKRHYFNPKASATMDGSPGHHPKAAIVDILPSVAQIGSGARMKVPGRG